MMAFCMVAYNVARVACILDRAMIIGIGVDLCPAARWQRLLNRYGVRSLGRMLSEREMNFLLKGDSKKLAERAAGRWALREALGKAMGIGLEGWKLRELQYLDGQATAEGNLKKKLNELEVSKIHATLTHDCGLSVALVVLESNLAIW
jgi:holo-[acyl-carrier protein] synthase